MNFLHTNPYIKSTIILFLIMYASNARPELQPHIKKLFENPIFRLVILFLIVYYGNKDPVISLIMAVAFILGMNKLSELELKESFDQIEQFHQFSVHEHST